jgi:two-component system heavy metal sensor histidine kinase CusS
MSSTTTGDRPWSLAARLTAWYAGSAFALVLATSGFLYWAMVRGLDREDVETLRDPIVALRAVLRGGPADVAKVRREVEWVWAIRPVSQLHVRLLDAAGTTVGETPGMTGLLPPAVFPPPVAVDAEPGFEVETVADGRPFRLTAANATAGPTGDAVFVIQAALDRSPEEDLLAEFRRYLGLALAVALVGCAAGGYWIARRGVRPLADITAAAGRVRPTTLNERIGVAGLPAELHELARTFNTMLDRLEESFARV